MFIQIDKLVQLLESPVFTCRCFIEPVYVSPLIRFLLVLRLHLLEPDRYPYLYKCLYGILMLLPQSAAFAALKNRLNSVSAIGYLPVPQPPQSRGSIAGTGSTSNTPATTPVATNFERGTGRIKSKEEGTVKWSELLDRFRTMQDRGKRLSRAGSQSDEDRPSSQVPVQAMGQFARKGQDAAAHGVTEQRRLLGPANIDPVQRSKTSPAVSGEASGGRMSVGGPSGTRGGGPNTATQGAAHEKEKKPRFSAARFGKLASGVKGGQKK